MASKGPRRDGTCSGVCSWYPSRPEHSRSRHVVSAQHIDKTRVSFERRQMQRSQLLLVWFAIVTSAFFSISNTAMSTSLLINGSARCNRVEFVSSKTFYFAPRSNSDPITLCFPLAAARRSGVKFFVTSIHIGRETA